MKEDCFCFDDFNVDPSSLTISSTNGEQQIEYRYMQLLCLLAASNNALLTREQISDVLWPDVVVGSDNITSAIFALRSLLGDNARNPKYIQTVPKKGYRFLPEVRYQTSPILDNTERTSRKKLTFKHPRLILFTVTAVILFTVMTTFYQHKTPQQPASLAEFSVGKLTPFTYQDGAEVSLAVNTSINQLAYIHKKDGQFDVYTKPLGGGKAVRWTNNSHRKRGLQWLNDDTLLYLQCIYSSNRRCQLVSLNSNGDETVLYETSRRLRQLTPFKRSEQRWLFVEQRNQQTTELMEIDLAERTVSPWRDKYPELPQKIAFPHVDPEHKTLFFIKIAGGRPSLHALDLASSSITLLNNAFEQVQYFAGVNTDYGLISGKADGRSGIWLYNYEEGETRLLVPTVSDEFINSAYLDIPKQVLYYATIRSNSDIVEYHRDGQAGEAINGINSSFEDYYPTTDSGNKHVYFVSNRSGAHELWRFSYSSKQSEKLTDLNATDFTRPLVSPNGQFVAFVVEAQELKLIVLDTVLKDIVASRSLNELQSILSWSNDGRHLYTMEYNRRGNARQYSAPDLMEEQLLSSSTPLYQEALRDHHLYYADIDSNSIKYKNLNDGSEQAVTEIAYPLKRLHPEKIRKAGDRLYIAQRDATNTAESLYEYRFKLNEPTEAADTGKLILDLPTGMLIEHISADGSTVLAIDKTKAFGSIIQANLEAP